MASAVNRLPTTRHSLLLRLADASDNAAWIEFLEVYETTSFRFVCSRGLQPTDAEDVTQRVLTAVMEKSRNWQPDAARGSFGAWLFRVARNLSAKAWNEQARKPIGNGDSASAALLAEVPGPSNDDQTVFHLEYRRALFHWAADRVRERVNDATWQAFWMTAAEQQDAKDVAQGLGMSLSSVYTAKCRMLARIRQEIDCFENELSIHDNSH